MRYAELVKEMPDNDILEFSYCDKNRNWKMKIFMDTIFLSDDKTGRSTGVQWGVKMTKWQRAKGIIDQLNKVSWCNPKAVTTLVNYLEYHIKDCDYTIDMLKGEIEKYADKRASSWVKEKEKAIKGIEKKKKLIEKALKEVDVSGI